MMVKVWGRLVLRALPNPVSPDTVNICLVLTAPVLLLAFPVSLSQHIFFGGGC